MVITVAQALDLLKLTQQQWFRMVTHYPWLPRPLDNGSPYNLTSRFLIQDVQDIAEAFKLPVQPERN